MKLEAVIFDVDGTLADSEELHRRAFNDAFVAHGLDWHWSQARYAQLLAVTGGKERLRAHVDSLDLPSGQSRAVCMRIGDIHRTKTDLYTVLLRAGALQLRDGVRELLQECADAGIQLAIATTTTAANVDALLASNLGGDAAKLFAVIGSGESVARKKPWPDVYLWVLQRLGQDAEDCVAVEDSLNGLRAAKAAGLRTVVTPSYWTADEDFSSADLVLPSLSQFGLRQLSKQFDRAAQQCP